MLKYIGCDSLQTSLRLRGAGSGYRIYYAMPGHINPNYNRHWFCNIFFAYSPGGIRPLPFSIWLGFPEGIINKLYHFGMIRAMLVESCRPDLGLRRTFGR